MTEADVRPLDQRAAESGAQKVGRSRWHAIVLGSNARHGAAKCVERVFVPPFLDLVNVRQPLGLVRTRFDGVVHYAGCLPERLNVRLGIACGLGLSKPDEKRIDVSRDARNALLGAYERRRAGPAVGIKHNDVGRLELLEQVAHEVN